jgi:hypothetical protein
MNIITNTKLIKRNAKIGQYTSLGALVILGAGLFISFQMKDTNSFTYSMVALLVGFILSQVGIHFTNRWGRNPRPDEVIDKSLKGLGREYCIYHYVTPVSHLLIGPAGLWTILPNFTAGKVTFDGKRWRVKGGGFLQSYIRLFGQDSIGRPDIESEAEIESVTRHLKRMLPEGTEIPEVQAALVFASPKVELEIDETPVPAMLPKDLKDYLREKGKQKIVDDTILSAIRAVLPLAERNE